MLNAIKQQQTEISLLRKLLRKQAAKDALLESRLAAVEHRQSAHAQLASASQAH